MRPDDALDEGESEADGGADVEIRCVDVPVEWHGSRLDRTLASLVPEFSRSYLQQLIEAGMVQLNGAVVIKPSTKPEPVMRSSSSFARHRRARLLFLKRWRWRSSLKMPGCW